MADGDRNAVLAWLREEHAKPFLGWDFSYIRERRTQIGEKAWDLETILAAEIPRASSLLDLGTGDGRFLADQLDRHGYRGKAFATESHPPNVLIAAARLRPLRIPVVQGDDEARAIGALPFVDGAFDLVLSRHTGFSPREVARVLRPGGRLVTQQVGDRTNLDIHRLLGLPPSERTPNNLALVRGWLEDAGLEVTLAEEAFPTTRYADVGALVYYLKAVSWEVPDFDVNRYAEPLLALHARGEPIDVGFHLFMLVAVRR